VDRVTVKETSPQEEPGGALTWLVGSLGRVIVSLIVPLIAFFVFWRGFVFLRDTDAPKIVVVAIAILWGVGGVAMLFVLTNWLIEKLPHAWTARLRPFVFVGPALAILGWYLLFPALRSLYLSFFNANSTQFIGLDNYIFAFTNPEMLISFRNNVLWIVLGTGFSVLIGLLIAVLADRTRMEVVYKGLIFLPMAISFVGASVIWRFIYAYQPAGSDQIGLLNYLWTSLGNDPVALLTMRPWNNLALIAILIWLQTGFAMVLLSAAVKGVPKELLEAARIDGANEFQVFLRVIVPYIRGTIITVTTTIVIMTLKIFDIVFVMTNGNLGTEVIASRMYKEMFRFRDFGRGSAIAIVLLVAVLPVMWYNLSRFREEETF
jgi:alpha-glucoside transport system permease protein